MSQLQRLIEDYLLEQGWRASPPVDGAESLRKLRYWKDPEYPSSAACGLPEAVRRVMRRERRRAGAPRGEIIT